jgi:hypothetical protein
MYLSAWFQGRRLKNSGTKDTKERSVFDDRAHIFRCELTVGSSTQLTATLLILRGLGRQTVRYSSEV